MVAKSAPPHRGGRQTLHAESVGDGPDVVLLHGLFGMGSNLGGLARSLAEGYRVHCIDLPGHGRSGPAGAAGLPAMAAALLAWLDAQRMDAVRLCGHSLGGKVAMQLALTAPERVAALVVGDIAPVSYAPSHDAVFAATAAVEAAAVASRREAAPVLRRYLDEEAVIQFLLLSLARDADGRWRWRFDRAGLEASYPALLAAPEATAPYEGPALFIRGERSGYLSRAHAAAIRPFFPRARVETLPDCGHWLHVEAPRRFQSLVRGFFDGRGGPAP